MNERIRELAEQAGVDAGQTIANTICGVCGDDEWVALGNEFNKLSQKTRDLIYKTLEQNQEKFAELIVQECIAQIRPMWNQVKEVGAPPGYDYDTFDLVYNDCMNAIKEHFGVEE